MDRIKFLELETDLFDFEYADELSVRDAEQIVWSIIALARKNRLMRDVEQERFKLAVLRLKEKKFFKWLDDSYNFLYRRLHNEIKSKIVKSWIGIN